MDYNLPTAVYRLYDADGVLLYIGMTRNPKQRWKDHRKEMLWWPEVTEKKLTWYDTRWAAWDAELTAIPSESPRYNLGSERPVLPSGIPPQPTGHRIAYQCKEERPAYRLAWFTWRAQLRDAYPNPEERAALG